jgi:hypothetical protein
MAMWLISAIRRNGYRRRYRTAIAVLAAAHTFELLSTAQREVVETEVSRLLNRGAWIFGGSISSPEHRRWASWPARMAYRAEAMRKLNIAPAIPDLNWTDLLGSESRLFTGIPWFVHIVAGEPASVEACAFLRSRGVTVNWPVPEAPYAGSTLRQWLSRPH